MGVTFEYFAAVDDAAAAALAGTGPTAAGVRTATAGGLVDPTVHLVPLVALLTGRPPAETGPAFRDPVAVVGGGEQVVLPLTDAVTGALRLAEPDADTVAVTWARDAGFWQAPDPAVLADFLRELRGVARPGRPLYCRLSV